MLNLQQDKRLDQFTYIFNFEWLQLYIRQGKKIQDLASLRNILRCKHSCIRGGFIPVSFNLHTTCTWGKRVKEKYRDKSNYVLASSKQTHNKKDINFETQRRNCTSNAHKSFSSRQVSHMLHTIQNTFKWLKTVKLKYTKKKKNSNLDQVWYLQWKCH